MKCKTIFGFLLIIALLFLGACQTAIDSGQAEDATLAFRTEREHPGSEAGKPYSPAVKVVRIGSSQGLDKVVAETLYVSGQVGADPETGEKVEGDIQAETRQVLANLKGIVESSGFQMSDAVRCTVYLLDMDDYAAVNEAYLEFFPADPPSRACVGVSELVGDYRIEISLVAEK